MKHVLFLFISIILMTSCENDSGNASRLLDFAPSNTSIFINGNSIDNLSTAIDHNALLVEMLSYNKIKSLGNELQILKHLRLDNEFLLCLSKTENDSLDFTLISKVTNGYLNLDSIPNAISESFKSQRRTLTKTSVNGQEFFSVIIDSTLIGSNTLSIIDGISAKKSVDPELEGIYKSWGHDKSLTVIANVKEGRAMPLLFNDATLDKLQFSNYILLDVDISQDDMVCNGITKALDSSKSLINVFKNTFPQVNGIPAIAPSSSDYVLSFTYSNFKTLSDNLRKYIRTDSLVVSTIFDNSVEIGLVKMDVDEAVILKSIDASLTQSALESHHIEDTFREIPIYTYDRPEIFNHIIAPLIHNRTASKYLVLDDFFVFSDSIDFLKTIVSNYLSKATLSENNAFKNMMHDLSDASSIFVYNNTSSLNATLNKNFNEDLQLNIDAYKAGAIQFVYDTDFAHINAVFKTFKSRGAANSVSENLDITLDADFQMAPQLVGNHTNSQKDIVVQDINNNLYLFSNQGKLFWKKQLDGKILGKIEQMDIYKNGRLQLVFATPNRVYVLDRNGKEVAPFPLKFNDEITQPLSLFDYDNNKNYRLLVTQGNALLMYDRLGKQVKGFDFKTESDHIMSQPKHFRIGRKDFIVFPQGNKLKVLDRTGKPRMAVKENIDFSGNDIHLYNNDFVTTNNNGALIKVDQQGGMASSNLNLKDGHFITSTSKTLVTLSDNRLTIKSHTVELDYGDYTAPQIFYINDKIYVTTTDLQANKIYLFDSLGKPIANFPIYGTSSIAMDNIDKDNQLEVIVKGDDNGIIVYEIN